MSMSMGRLERFMPRLLTFVLAFSAIVGVGALSRGQGNGGGGGNNGGGNGGGNNNLNGFFTRNVGGITIDAEGVLTRGEYITDKETLEAVRAASAALPNDMKGRGALRKISLKKLNTAIVNHLAKNDNTPLPDEIRFLAGLQRVQYVFVYPEENDIVLAGFGEGWKVLDSGNVVGLTTGRQVLMLDDLLVALRSAEQARQGGISCSIDPTPDGLQRFVELQKSLTAAALEGQPRAILDNLQTALGLQTISVEGVDKDTHFARVLVAADYRMKCLAMNLVDKQPLKDLPNYLGMVQSSSRGVPSSLPRWWLATDYEPLRTDGAGLAWELRGPGVKTMTEDSQLAANGNLKSTGKSSGPAKRWADLMTSKYEALSLKEPIFAELRNIMDLAVIGALISKERLIEKAGLEAHSLLSKEGMATASFATPKHVPSIASVVNTKKSYVISASGGVMLDSWQVADRKETSKDIDQTRADAKVAGRDADWWWN